MKKILSLILALALVSICAAAFAADLADGSIQITPPAGLPEDAANTYLIYKVFDATSSGAGISYKLVEGKTTAPTGFSVDSAGNVTTELTALDADTIAAIAAYVADDEPVATATSTGSAAALAEGLGAGYYYITTSTGSIVTIDSTHPAADVEDKNSPPTIEKKISSASSADSDGLKAQAQAGSDVVYTVKIVVGKGAIGYKFHDKMDITLEYNGDMAITGIDASKYTIQTTPDEGDTVTVAFADGLEKDTEITLTYSAKVLSDALQTTPAKNSATISYGKDSSYTSEEQKTEVYNAKMSVTKLDGGSQPLADAGFVIKNAAGKYYKNESGVVSWVEEVADATENVSAADGAVPAFTGLAAGTYTLVEKTVPDGFNTAADQTFTVAEHDYSTLNLEQTAEVINNAGTELPSTGGIGTTILYVVGGLLIVGAAVILIARRKAESK